MNQVNGKMRRGTTGALLLCLLALGMSACIEEGNPAIKSLSLSGDATSPQTPPPQTPAANTTPTISGSPPAAIQAKQAYTFAPAAADGDGDALAFQVSNKPAWATFSPTTGRLTGTPADADVGIYKNITITVSDGKASRSLPAFTVTVNQISLGRATLSWMPPTEHIDGSTLTSLAGYHVYFSTNPDALGGQKVVLSNPSITRHIVENLGPGKWYFSIKSYTGAGLESEFSAVATKTII